jgi:hypothetical protein
MKITFISLALMLLLSNLPFAYSNSQPNSKFILSEKKNNHSILVFNTDGDNTKAEKKQLTEKSKDANDSASLIVNENDFGYLRFDVNTYINNDNSEIEELPAFEYESLRFDVTKYMIENPGSLKEMPVNEFDHLRFDVSKYSSSDSETNSIGELPENE